MGNQDIETVFCCRPSGAVSKRRSNTTSTRRWPQLHAFNLWLEEDWGFDRPDGRIIAAPIVSLADPETAVEELEFVLAGRARTLVLVRPAPVPGVAKPRSLGDPLHDPVWATLAEAGVPVAFHLSDSGYLQFAASVGWQVDLRGVRRPSPSRSTR